MANGSLEALHRGRQRRQPSPGRGGPRRWLRPFEERGGRAAPSRPRYPLHGGHRHRDAAQRARCPCHEHVHCACPREGGRRRIVMVDDGDGVPPALHEHVFEPRVTSKLDTMHLDKWGVHGRGMALYSIAVNAETARIAASDAGRGSSFVVETDLARVGEKADQSSFPVFERTDAGTVAVRGPKNILRTVCEFALECRRDCTVYLGSVTDVVATLYAFGLSSLTAASRAFGASRRAARVQAPGPRRRPGGARRPRRVAGARPVRAFGAPRAGRRDSAPVPAARPRAHRQRRTRACSPAHRRPVCLPGRAGSQAGPRGSGRLRWPAWPLPTATSLNATTWSPTCSPRCAWARTASASISP